MKKIEVGQRVEVIANRDEYDKNSKSMVQEVPIGWEGTVTGVGITEDQLYYAYDLKGEDGLEVKNYNSRCLIHIIPGVERKVSTIVGNVNLYIDDEVEAAELETALNYIIAKYLDLKVGRGTIDRIRKLMNIVYLYGKTVGKRQEREEKKGKGKSSPNRSQISNYYTN